MALSIARQDDAPNPRDAWVPVKRAATLLDMTERHLRRLCVERHEPEGLAKKIGKQWFVSPLVDERLRPVDPAKRDREDEADLAKFGVPARHIDKAVAIRDLLAHFAAFDSRGMTARDARAAFLSHAESTGLLASLDIHKRPGLTTFYNWERKYRDGGIASLTRKQSADTESPAGTAALRYIENLVNCGNRISINQAITLAYAEAANHPGDPSWKIPSYSTVRVWLAERRPQTLRVITDKGERAARAQTVPHGHRDFEEMDVNDEWNGDECKLDVLHRVLTSRGWQARRAAVITTWQDMRSRAITGAVIASYADSNTILAAAKCGFRDYGVPKVLRTDWGKDYQKAVGTSLGKRFKHKGFREFDGRRIASIFDRLGVEVRPVLPYRPQSKPIESFYNTLHGLFCKMFPSYIGGSPEARHEDRMAWAKKNVEKLPTLDELCDLLPIALDTYHATPHGAIDMFGKSPSEALAAFAPDVVRRESPAVLDHLFKTFVGPKTVRRDGIKHNSRWYRDPANRIVELHKQKVLLAIQPDDMSKAMVCRIDDDRTPLFEVECIPLRGFSARDAKRIAQDQQRVLKPFREQAKSARKLFESIDPRKRLEDQRRGAAARYGTELPDAGSGVAAAADAPTVLRLQSDLETALSKADRIADDEASEAVRTGTDDITIDDMLGDDLPPTRYVADDDGLSADDFYGFGDAGGDD